MRGRPAGSISLLSDKEVAQICLECKLPSKTCNRLRCSYFNKTIKDLQNKKLKELENRNDNKR